MSVNHIWRGVGKQNRQIELILFWMENCLSYSIQNFLKLTFCLYNASIAMSFLCKEMLNNCLFSVNSILHPFISVHIDGKFVKRIQSLHYQIGLKKSMIEALRFCCYQFDTSKMYGMKWIERCKFYLFKKHDTNR